jgi:hypothetical protein
MKFFLKIFGLIFLSFVICYLLLPSPSFPPPPEGALRSIEPGDMESIYRRAYFTNFSRSEVLNYYGHLFGGYLLNYPPEESFTLIRDQTKSSWLQEFVHPLKESLYVNGFYPTKPTEQININGIHYTNKLTIRYMPSHPVARLTGLTLCLICSYWLYREYVQI